MARLKTVNDNAEFLTYALIHLEKERDIVLAKIANIKQQLGLGKAPVGRPKKVAVPAAAVVAAPAAASKEKKTRELSPAARKRISQAQKKRWLRAAKKKVVTTSRTG